MRAGCAGGRRTGVRARRAGWSGLGRCVAHGLCERDGLDEFALVCVGAVVGRPGDTVGLRGRVTSRRTGALRVVVWFRSMWRVWSVRARWSG